MLFTRGCGIRLVLVLIGMSHGIARGDLANPQNPSELKEAFDRSYRNGDFEKLLLRQHRIPKERVKRLAEVMHADFEKSGFEIAEAALQFGRRKGYSGAITLRLVVCALAEYRAGEEGLNQRPIDSKAFQLLAQKFAYVKVESDPPDAALLVGSIQFDPTNSDGFVPVNNDRVKVVVRLNKKGFDQFEKEVELSTSRKNEFKFPLVAVKADPVNPQK